MDAIINNPFRILGLPTTASDKEIAKRVSDLLIYAELGKKVSYETDFTFLGELDRSVDAIKLAAKKIELPEYKIFYSLLCFDLKDNSEKESIEFILQGDFKSALELLNIEIENNSAIAYRSHRGTNNYNILKNLDIVDNDDYSIQKATAPPAANMAASLFAMQYKQIIIKDNDGFIDISEANSRINFTDKYQISCRFKWVPINGLYHLDNQEESLGLGFLNSLNEKHFVLFYQSGLIRFFRSNILEHEIEVNRSIYYEKKSNFIAFQRYDNYLEIILNNNSIIKIETNESFQKSFLCF